jgi:hypothetical protein
MFQLGRECEEGWRCLNGTEQIEKLIAGVRFIDGLAEKYRLNMLRAFPSQLSAHNTRKYL